MVSILVIYSRRIAGFCIQDVFEKLGLVCCLWIWRPGLYKLDLGFRLWMPAIGLGLLDLDLGAQFSELGSGFLDIQFRT